MNSLSKNKLMLMAIMLMFTILLAGEALLKRNVIVIFRDNTSQVEKDHIVKIFGLTCIKELTLINGRSTCLSNKCIEELKDNSNVKAVYENARIQAFSDKVNYSICQPMEIIPWGIAAINADKSNYDGTGVKVGVLDTGIDSDHPDLVGRVIGGKNFIDTDSSYMDDNGHGTHVAGIIAATNNDIGVVGASPNVQLYALKVLDSTCNGNIADIIEGIQWAVEKDLDVINMSLGTNTDSPALSLAVKIAAESGLLMVASIGNDKDSVDYPAAYNNVIGVAAVYPNFLITPFSPHGTQVDIAAPGGDVLSTIPGGRYAYFSGTSMAAPHVTGILAQMIQAFRETKQPVDYDSMIQKIIDGADSLGDQNYYGAGLINGLCATN